MRSSLLRLVRPATAAVATAALLLGSHACLAQSGDPARGATLYRTTYKCTDCHASALSPASPLKSGATVAGLLASIDAVSGMTQRYSLNLATRPVDVADIAAFIASQTDGAQAVAPVIEYYHAEWDHYFITAIPAEITALDAGTFVGWQRTGLQFNVFPSVTTGASTVCRFFSTAFAPRSSHFYTPSSIECATVKTNPAWQYEGDVLYIAVAAPDGTCAAGTAPVYRLYNNGAGGAPNHRYTTDAATRDLMLARGWVIEGNGPGFAFMCAPS